MSTKKQFTPEEIRHLRANPYMRCVTADTISYTLAFKEAFWALSLQGYTGPAAFRKLGYNTEVLGAAIQEALADRKNNLAVKELCELAGVSRSGYYNWVQFERARETRKQKDLADFVRITDITYIPLNGKFCYLSTILDACTKQVLSYAMSKSLEVDFVLEMVERLAQNHGASLNKETVIHSDQGTHYTSLKFIQLVESRELRRSMSRRGNC